MAYGGGANKWSLGHTPVEAVTVCRLLNPIVLSIRCECLAGGGCLGKSQDRPAQGPCGLESGRGTPLA